MANIKDLIQSIESGDSSFDEKLAAINAMEETLIAVRTKEQEAIDGGVAMIVDAVATMQRKVEAQIEVAKAIVPEKGDAGHDGKDGRDGKNGQDGRNGIDGQPGPAGKDGEDGVSVVDAKIDFDGSLVIGLSSGREINVGEVVAADLAEKIKVTMSTNSTVVVQDEGTTITSGVRSLNFTGTGVTATASGDSVTVNVTGGGGGGGVTSVTGTAPVVSSGGTTPAISLAAGYGDTLNPYASKTANNFLAAPNGSAGVPTFRAVVAADIPTLNQNTTGTASNVTGIVAVANGGSGTATPSLVAGTNVTVTGTWPNQTIAASGGGGGGSTLVISNKTAAYTVVAGDLASVINCTANTFTVSLTAAATLGAGFNVTIWNTSNTTANAITIDPNGAETIDGAATRILRRGEGMQIVCNGTNWETGDKKTMRGYAENLDSTNTLPSAAGENAISIGPDAVASAQNSLAISNPGSGATASGVGAIAINGTSSNTRTISLGRGTTASAAYATAIGANSATQASQAVTGSGAMALGGSYASGTDSFAAAIANNTSTYGAKGANSVAIGQTALASGSNSVAIGQLTTASASFAYSLGYSSTASGTDSIAFGNRADTAGIIGKYTFGGGAAVFMSGMQVLRAGTTDATATALSSNASAAASTNQVILPNNSAYAFTGTVVARRQASGGTESAAWKVEGLIRREANAGTTTLVFSLVTAISNVPLWTLALSADTTNGGLAVTATGAAATNIRWVATIETSEVTYA